MKKHFYLLVLTACIISCGNVDNKTKDDSLIHIKIEKPDVSHLEPLLLSEFIDSIEYIQLETTNDCLMPYHGLGRKVLIDCLLIFYDRYSILTFNAVSGKFLNKIGKKGQGPGEYVQIQDLCIDKDNNRIVLKDSGKQAILTYNYEGKYLGNISFENIEESIFTNCLYSVSLADIDDQYMVYIDNNHIPAEYACQSNEIIVYDYKNKNILHTESNKMGGTYNRFNRKITGIQNMAKYDNKLFYKSFYNDTLYIIQRERGINPFAIIDLGRYKLPTEFILSENSHSEILGKIQINSIYIDNKNILFECYCVNDENLKDIMSFICKFETETKKLTYHSNLMNDIDGGQNSNLEGLSLGCWYVIPPDEIKNENKKYVCSLLNKSELKHPELKDKFERMQEARDPDDNPLIMILHK